MSWVSGTAVFFIVWWTVLFAVLPWGVRPQEEPEPGTVESAPSRPRLLFKFAMTTAVTAVIWLVIYGVVASDIISFRDMARDL